jgi:hypothetical protein
VDDDLFRSALHILHWAVALARNADDEVAERARGLQAYTVVVVQSSPGAAELATAVKSGDWTLDNQGCSAAARTSQSQCCAVQSHYCTVHAQRGELVQYTLRPKNMQFSFFEKLNNLNFDSIYIKN